MSKLVEIHEKIGNLPEDLPKLYLLGSTGAGKTTIVRSILGTEDYNFPSVSQIRTTVTATEYVIDSTLSYKTTFIFKEEKEILDSIEEILLSAIVFSFKIVNNDSQIEEKIKNKLEETSDERFRLKYIIDDDFLSAIASEIITNNKISLILGNLKNGEKNLKTFIDPTENDDIKGIIKNLSDKLFLEVKNKIKEISGIAYPPKDLKYYFEKDNKKDFINENIKFLSNQKGSLSPLIKYARIEGDLLASWIPKEYKFVLIDGEGIGHNLKDISSELSVRHLDFFNISDEILLIEKGDDPFVSGGNKACKSIYMNGYIDKLNLIFSKTDKIDIDSDTYNLSEVKKIISKRIANLENALKSDESIDFDVAEKKLYYLAQSNEKINEESKKQILNLLKIAIFSKNDNGNKNKNEPLKASLEYDFSTLLNYYDNDILLTKWDNILDREAWQTIKAFNKRMYWEEDEYKHLKPISDYHSVIMKTMDIFLRRPIVNELNSGEFEIKINTTKQKLSNLLLKDIRNVILVNHNDNWKNTLLLNGLGSTNTRREQIKKIFKKVIYQKNNNDFFELLKNYLVNDCELKEVSELKNISITDVSIKQMWKKYDIKWELDEKINILIGKNGTGKSTVLKLVANQNMLEKFKTKSISIKIIKNYKNGFFQEITDNSKIEDIDDTKQLKEIVYIDTFDNEEQSDLNKNLKDLIYAENGFNSYIGKLEKIYDEKIQNIEQEIERIISNGSSDDFIRLQKLNLEKKESYSKIYEPLKKFEKIINIFFGDTEKKIDLKNENYPFIFKIEENEYIEYSLLSSGEKQILIILLTVLLKEQAPIILILDEPEISLHVEWQSKLIDNLIELNPNMQIIIATHSPALLSDGWSDKVTKISEIITKS